MIVYEATKWQFLRHSNDYDIGDIIHEHYYNKTGRRVGESEHRSWAHSLTEMAKTLSDESIPGDMGVAVELHIPQSSRRIDVTLSGYDENRTKKAIIVELKQWDRIATTDKDAIVTTYLGGSEREVPHPSYQAWSYASLLHDFNEAVHVGDIKVEACAYLHNYPRDGKIDSDHYIEHIQKAPLFLKGPSERSLLRDFIKRHVKYGDDRAILYEIDHGRIRPSKALADALAGLLQNKPEFVLIDDQKVVFEAIQTAIKSATPAAPRVVIVKGGPGTGKTVLAINLLAKLIEEFRLNGQYVSKNAAPREVYKSRLTGTIKKSRFEHLFKGSGSYINAKQNEFDFLLVDEAHRLNEKSGMFSNLGENQIKEAIQASACTVFFIDEDQRIAFNDIGSIERITSFARAKGASIETLELASQFRCNGSDGYLAWLDQALDIRPTANDTLDVASYDFQVLDDPQALHDLITSKNTNNKARVVAGYCWPWRSKNDPTQQDIVIGDSYQRQWNLTKDGSLWIMSPGSIEQVGCIHTCQGLEVDYIGVIIGPDLIVRDSKIITLPEMRDRHDSTMKGYKTRLKLDPGSTQIEADLIIKNTYRTLMTRGMKGCYLYCTDTETREYFRSLINMDM